MPLSTTDFDIVMALDSIGAPPVQKLLASFLRDADPFVAFQLALLGLKAQQAIPSLHAALTDKRPQARISAAVALAHIDPAAAESIPALVEGLNHLDDNTLDAEYVPAALARLGPKARTAIPTLIDLVKKKSDHSDVLTALVQIDPEGTECVPALITALDHDDYGVVDTAANCLGLLGRQARDAVPALAKAVTRKFDEEFDSGVDPQVSAAKALRRIGPEATSAIPALIGALKYRRVVRPNIDGSPDDYADYSAAAAAAEVLGSFGSEAKAAIPAH